MPRGLALESAPRMRVHHLVQSLVPGDAMGAAAVEFAALARSLGHAGEIFAVDLSPELVALARPAPALAPAPDDLVLYHHGIGSPLVSRLLMWRCRKAVVYHNVTPARFYPGTRIVEYLDQGRAQLRALAGRVDVAIGVSPYNARELAAAGHHDPAIVPLPVDPRRLDEVPGVRRARHLEVLCVGRVVVHKRVDQAIEVFRALRATRPDARLTVVGTCDGGSEHVRALFRASRDLPDLRFAGKVTHEELVRHYREARAFLSMSEHEGFGVPLVEAMVCGVPVFARAAAGVPDTLGGAGVAFDDASPHEVAALIAAVDEDDSVRSRLLDGQTRRARDFEPARAAEALGAALARVAPARPRVRPVRPQPRVAFVVQRYGEVVGGAERLCRLVAERMARHWDVEVLTTCARDFITWANAVPAGESREGGVMVRRFPVRRPRNVVAFNGLSGGMFGRRHDRVAEERWLAEQGPVAPGLLAHLADLAYDGYVFFTYLYATTVHGLPLVSGRAVLVPTAHDEPAIRFGLYRDVFAAPRELLCSSPEEVALIERLFPDAAPRREVGIGVEAPPADGDRFRRRRNLPGTYLLYLGRIDSKKGCPELLAQYALLRRRDPEGPPLVLVGEASIPVGGEGVVHVGRVDDAEKHDAIAGAIAVVMPSPMESLSLTTLEAMAHGRPALVNADCDVLAGHVARSGGGIAYRGADGLAEAIARARRDGEAMGRRGRAYVEGRYTWTRIEDAYLDVADRHFHPGASPEAAPAARGAS